MRHRHSTRAPWASAVALLLTLASGTQSAAAQDAPAAVTLRPIDRATVRIVSVRGLGIHRGPGRRTRVARVAADPSTSHGSGVAIGPQLILTARHVVWAAEAWVVFPPGSSTPIPARPVYVDPGQDLAFLYVDRPLEDHVTLPEARQLTINERVSVSGYPLDLRESIPAAASGEVSRVTRTGELHLTMTINPGHSGGPVIDSAGRVVGIVSARGRLEAGVEGLAVAVTLQDVRAAHARVPAERPSLGDVDRDLASAIAILTRIGEVPLIERIPQTTPLVQRALEWSGGQADRDIIVAGLAWNTLVDLLEARSAPSIEQLPSAERATATALHTGARRLAARALNDGPHIRRRFPIARAIALGHLDAEAERPAPFR